MNAELPLHSTYCFTHQGLLAANFISLTLSWSHSH